MSVFKRSDGRWVVKYKDASGKRVQKTFKDRKEAFEFDDELYQDGRVASRLTVFEAVTLYIKDHSYLSNSVKDAYSWLMCGAERKSGRTVGYAECIADKYVDELTRRDLNAVRDNVRAKRASNATVNYWTAKLEAVFNYCASEGLVKSNPWKGFAKLREEVRHHDGTIDDFRRIYAVLPDWMQWWCRTAISLCLRPGRVELFGLQWKAFDFRFGSVTVYMGKVGRPKIVYPAQEYMAEAKRRFLADGENREQYVCRGFNGGKVRNYFQTWRSYCIKAGVRMPFYALRHIAASMMLEAGADVAAVAANLGHKNPSITLQYYAHALPSAQRSACTRMGAVWCENQEKSSIKSIG